MSSGRCVGKAADAPLGAIVKESPLVEDVAPRNINEDVTRNSALCVLSPHVRVDFLVIGNHSLTEGQ
jgi:hypothetical protein